VLRLSQPAFTQLPSRGGASVPGRGRPFRGYLAGGAAALAGLETLVGIQGPSADRFAATSAIVPARLASSSGGSR